MQLPTINGQTRLLGVLADPVAQARSPGMANALLQEKGLFGEYVVVPLHVSASSLVNVIEGLRHLQNFAGTIVSMPHKSAVLPFLDEISPEASLIGAVNVIRREPDGRLVGEPLMAKALWRVCARQDMMCVARPAYWLGLVGQQRRLRLRWPNMAVSPSLSAIALQPKRRHLRLACTRRTRIYR